MEENEARMIDIILEKSKRLQDNLVKHNIESVLGEPIYTIKNIVIETNKILLLNKLDKIDDIYTKTVGGSHVYIDKIELITKLSEIIATLSVLSGSSKRSVQKQISVFISHGQESLSLQKLARFVEAFGFNAIIVEHQASEGKTVPDHVENKMKISDCVIILATKDDNIGGKYYPRQNVIQEEGMATQILKGKIIYLLEEGCSLPSNISPRVWESFTQDNMEKAYLKIVREFKSFQFI
jgi:predicted nucleotide-binding protein